MILLLELAKPHMASFPTRDTLVSLGLLGHMSAEAFSALAPLEVDSLQWSELYSQV